MVAAQLKMVEVTSTSTVKVVEAPSAAAEVVELAASSLATTSLRWWA